MKNITFKRLKLKSISERIGSLRNRIEHVKRWKKQRMRNTSRSGGDQLEPAMLRMACSIVELSRWR